MKHRPGAAQEHLSLEGAAARLGIPADELRDRASEGEIPGAVLGTSGWRFPARAIARLAETNPS